MKQKTLRQLRDICWKLTSKIVRVQNPNCYTCKKHIPNMADRHCGHFYTKKGHPATRFERDNLRTQCFGCNHYKSGDIQNFAGNLIDEIGIERFNALRLLAKSTTQLRRQELEDMIAERTKILNQLI